MRLRLEIDEDAGVTMNRVGAGKSKAGEMGV